MHIPHMTHGLTLKRMRYKYGRQLPIPTLPLYKLNDIYNFVNFTFVKKQQCFVRRCILQLQLVFKMPVRNDILLLYVKSLSNRYIYTTKSRIPCTRTKNDMNDTWSRDDMFSSCLKAFLNLTNYYIFYFHSTFYIVSTRK